MNLKMIEAAKLIEEKGGRLYLVGGAVRDKILNIENHDEDYCVTGLDEYDIKELFENAKLVGKEFPVFLINDCEVALARIERKNGVGYKGFEIKTSKQISIEEDLKRRDITINAMAQDVLTGEFIDPYEGQKDIKEKVIRKVSEAFLEDPLRVYRAARFSAKYNFKIEEETLKLMTNLKEELNYLNSERVFVELKKALELEQPSRFFEELKKANVLDVHFKEIFDLIDVPQPEQYHPEGDVFNHTMIVLDKTSKETKDVEVRFAALVHDLGKANTPKDILPKHIGHETRGIEIIERMCERLKLPTRWKKIGKEVSEYHMMAGRYYEMRPYKQAVFFNKIDSSSIGLENLEIIANSDNMIGREKIEFSQKAKMMLREVTGKKLIEEGFNPKEMGGEKFYNLLLNRQCEWLKNYEKNKTNVLNCKCENPNEK